MSKNGVTLKLGVGVVQGHWKWSRSIDHIRLSIGTVIELFDIEWYHDLEIWVRCHSRSFKLVPFESLGAVSYSPSIVTMALSCIICKIKQDIGGKSWFFHAPLYSMLLLGASPSEYCHLVWCRRTRMVGLADVKKNFANICDHSHLILVCDGQIDILTQHSLHYAYCTMHTCHAVKTVIFNDTLIWPL